MPKQVNASVDECGGSGVAKLLRGYGPHAKIPLFDNDPNKFSNWRNQLHHFLLVLDLYKYLNNETEITESQDMDLYMAIASCVAGTTLNLVCTQAFGQGHEAYKLITQKFVGNADARETVSMLEITECKQGESESLTSYLDRFEQLKNRIEEFKIVTKNTLLVVLCLNGLNSKYAIFKNIMSTGKMPDWATFKEKIESHAAIMNLNTTKSNKVLNISDRYFPKVVKTRGTNFKKFNKFRPKCLKCLGKYHTTKNCTSDKFCEHCQNASHNTVDCRLKHKSSFNASQGNNLPGRSRGRYTQNRGRNQNRGRGRGNRPHYGAYRGGRGKFSTPQNHVNFVQENYNDFENIPNSSNNNENNDFLENPQYSGLLDTNAQNSQSQRGNKRKRQNQNFHYVNNVHEGNATNFNNMFL